MGGFVGFERSELHPGDHRIRLGGGSMTVPAVAVDSDTETPLVSLIKIDVQGAELLVLKGPSAPSKICGQRSFIEVDDGARENFGSSAQALVAHIEGRLRDV